MKENIRRVRDRIAKAATRSGRDPGAVRLVAVTKTLPVEQVRAAITAGIIDIGENRVQEASAKIEKIGHAVTWHMIGHLQSNKAGKVVQQFDMIQSLDSLELAEKVSEQAHKLGRRIDCLIEVNSSGEESKYGLPPSMALDTVQAASQFPGIVLRGIMTIGPLSDDPVKVRRAFDLTYRLFEKARGGAGLQFDILSMGMSGDFETAIEAGSTMVRIGTAIFGARP